MTKSGKIIVWIIVIVVVLGAWYFWSAKSAQSPVNNTVGENTAPVVQVSTDATLGDYLVAANGMTLYSYSKDTPGVSTCYDVCAVNWPPYSPAGGGAFIAGQGATGQFSTVTRTDGSTQLAYNGMPLYFWKNDVKPGDTTGQNVGGVWFVVKP